MKHTEVFTNVKSKPKSPNNNKERLKQRHTQECALLWEKDTKEKEQQIEAKSEAGIPHFPSLLK